MSVPAGFKATEVGVIPEDWALDTLGGIARLYQPVTIAGHQLKESGFPVYGANGVIGWYDKTNHEAWQSLVTCRGSTCGTVSKTNGPCWITGNAMVLNVDHNREIDKRFFYHLLTHQDFSVCITGSGQPQIVRAPLADFAVAVPPTITEQAAIAEALSDVDEAIAAQEAVIAKKRALKTATMQALLSGARRLPGYAGEWKEMRLGDTAILKARIGWQGLTTDEYLEAGDFYLGSGLIDQSQKMTVAARATAEKKAFGHRS